VITEPTPTGVDSLSHPPFPPVRVVSVIAMDRDSDELAASLLVPPGRDCRTDARAASARTNLGGVKPERDYEPIAATHLTVSAAKYRPLWEMHSSNPPFH
jgi:hypothetical protein